MCATSTRRGFHRWALLATLLTALPMAGASAADAFPNRPIRLILGTAPGGGADVTARMLAPALSAELGQSVIVENKPGASGMIAGDFVAKQPADGYTLFFDITSHAVNPALYPKMPYVPFKDLLPVTQLIQAPNVLVVHPDLPVRTLGEFVDYVKRQGKPMAYASSGNGTSQHLTAAMFGHQSQIPLTHVPYKGGGPAMVDVIAGHVPFMFAFLSSAAPHIEQGRLRALATTGSTRSKMLPDVPTVQEAGLPNFAAYDFNGIFVPAGTPPAVIDKLQQAFAKALKDKAVAAQLEKIGAETVGSTPAEFEQFLRAESDKWKKVIIEAGIKAN